MDSREEQRIIQQRRILNDKIERLEEENRQLKQQLASYNLPKIKLENHPRAAWGLVRHQRIILSMLMINAPRIVTFEQMEDALVLRRSGGCSDFGNKISVHIWAIRRALQQLNIEGDVTNIRTVGFKMGKHTAQAVWRHAQEIESSL